MLRQSMASNRSSHAVPVSSQAATLAAISRLNELKKEFEAVSAMERASAMFLRRIEGLGDDCDVMANAGEVHGQVLAQWPNMFRILSMFLADRAVQEARDGEEHTAASQSLEGQRLVRVGIEELQAASAQG